MNIHRTAAVVAAITFLAVPALADWDPGDPAKWVQNPDPQGWDVDITTDFVYDDWQCWGTGPVSDVHFWMSWQGDRVGQIAQVLVEIWDDVPAGADPDPTIPYSHPGVILWQGGFDPTQFTVRDAGFGDQGWLAPSFTDPQFNRPDHQQFFQVNIPTIDDPFIQKEGEIYWLGLHIRPVDGDPQPMAGWKTSLDHWNDDAAYYFAGWKELLDPITGESLDMAFVLTIPEPASIVLLLVAAVGVFATRINR